MSKTESGNRKPVHHRDTKTERKPVYPDGAKKTALPHLKQRHRGE
jgi:hypothetical protein